MRGLFWVLFIAALAVAVTLGARYNAGYVLIAVHPYRIELSLNLLLAILLLAFIAVYFLVRVVIRTLGLPSEVREFRDRRRLARAEASLLVALRAFFEGRYARAEKAALDLMDTREHSGFAAIIAARAAHELRAHDRRDRYLARAAYYDDADQTMRVVAQADVALQSRQHQEALAALSRIPRKHTAALRLELKAQQLARNWDRYLEVLGQIEKAGALEAIQVNELRRYAVSENLARKSRDPVELKEYWQKLSTRDRQDAKIASVGARAFMFLGDCAQAHAILEAGIEREWDSELVALYGECIGRETIKQIERAEGWLGAHPNDATLLLLLGKLCARERLWGKARSYLEASLSLEDGFDAHMELARLLDEIGEEQGAREHYRRGLGLAEAALRRQDRFRTAANGGGATQGVPTTA
jgi:HemY protein